MLGRPRGHLLIGGDQCTGGATSARSTQANRSRLTRASPAVAESVVAMGLKYATVTGVARDDLADGGAWLYAQTCREIHAAIPAAAWSCSSRLQRRAGRLAQVFDAAPEVLATTSRLCADLPAVRPGFRYARSLEVLRAAHEAAPHGLVTKSNLILGLGEERHEITEAMRDLRAAGVTC